MRLATQKKVFFLRGGVNIPAYSGLGRLQVGKPRTVTVKAKKNAITPTQRTFLTRPEPRPGGAAKKLAEIYSWGEGAGGQLGHGNVKSRKMPAKIEALSTKGIIFNHLNNPVSCGTLHAGVVNSFGETFTWGSNFFMQIGHDKSSDSGILSVDEREPTPSTLKNALPRRFTGKSLACGGWHNLLLGDKDSEEGPKRVVYVWGNGTQGQLGLALRRTRDEELEGKPAKPVLNVRYPRELEVLTKPLTDPSHIVQVAAGPTHSVALTKSGDVYWWGERRYVTEPEKLDLLVEEPLHFNSVVCGAFHTLGLTADGQLYSWGAGQINPELPLRSKLDPHFIASVNSVAPPARYKFTKIPLQDVVSIAASNDVSLALTRDKKLYFWEGTTGRPVHILKDKKIVDFAVSWTHIGAVTEDGALYMWRVEEDSLQDNNKDNYVPGAVPLELYLPGRTVSAPPLGSRATPLQLTHDPAPYSVPTRVEGVLAKKSVVGIKLGFNFAVATVIPKRAGPPPKRPNLRELCSRVNKLSPHKTKEEDTDNN